jgi:hypothetical protein
VWEWIVDPSVEPREDAYDRLVAATAPDGLPAPSLLASKVVDAGGAIHPASAPWPDIFEKEVSTAAAERRLVSLRATRAGSLLVREDVLDVYGRPEGDVLEWTARVLRGDHAGYLVPQSVAVRTDAADGRLSPRMLLGDAWRLEEKLWLSLLVMQGAARSRRRAAP